MSVLPIILLHWFANIIRRGGGGCLTNNNGSWIGRLHLLAFLLQLQRIITAYNLWLSKTRSIPYWTTSVFSSVVTDLVLNYESVTSASGVRWLTLHIWTLNSLTAELLLTRSSLHSFLCGLRVTMENVCCHGNVLAGNGIVRCCRNVCFASRSLQ
jgi:hypothetical protein